MNNERSTPIGLKPDSSEENLIDVSKLGTYYTNIYDANK